ncbi:MAG: hypothetical protein JSV34_04375 [Candidatus Omnitrophota bacterium]|nr:MAG: hypothetical protein JSV34_04375 [Candidatus Omnitrophota bacterium]
MIYRIKGKPVKKENNRVIIDMGGLFYEVGISASVYDRLNQQGQDVELIIYHYFNIDNNRAVPVLIGFIDELEKEFFEKFIKVSGIGPKAALRAFDKPISSIAQAIEEGDIAFLKTLAGIGTQRAKQIVAQLQGKVGRFALLKEEASEKREPGEAFITETKEVLRRLQYNSKEIEEMIKKAVVAKPQVENVEDLLNEIYRQRK